MSLTKATYSMINGAFVNVLDFGAVNDGVTDCTTAIQNAITYCLANDKSLFFPAGTYLYSPDSTFNIDLYTNSQSFKMFGEGASQSIIKLNYNGVAFNINNYYARGNFYLDSLGFTLNTPSTNNNATMFYFHAVIAGLPTWGASWNMNNCYFTGFTNCAVHGINIFFARTTGCRFFGNSAYTSTSGLLTTYDDAGVRMWGADGTSVSQTHAFSNQNIFQNCLFGNVKFGFDGWNAYNVEFDNCTFEPCWIGLINRPVPTAAYGTNTSTEKGGGNFAEFTYGNCWFEQNALYHISNVDVDNSGADVNPLKISKEFTFGGGYFTAVANQTKKMKPIANAGGFQSYRYMTGTSIKTDDPNYPIFYAFTNNPDETLYKFTPTNADFYVAPTFHTTSNIGGNWTGAHPIMQNSSGNDYHLWVDGSGKLRIKLGAPASDTDGTVVGTQT